MSDKLEALSQPVAVVVNKYGDPEAFGEREVKLLADIQKVPYNTNFYSQEYVTALLAALEEKDQRIAELNVKLFDQSILLDAAISRAEASGRREEHLKATVDVLSAKNAALEQQSEATQQGVQILTEAIGAHGYIVGCLERNRPDLALEESLKWMSVFAQAAEQVEGE